MGNKGMKWEDVDNKELSDKWGLTESEIAGLLTRFKSIGNGKIQVDVKQFNAILAKTREEDPVLVPFDEEVSGLLFQMIDSDHSGKVDPIELIVALSVFTRGDTDDKAKLIFKTLDRNDDNNLSTNELTKHVRRTLRFSARLVKQQYITDLTEAEMPPFLARMTGATMEKALNTLVEPVSADIVKEIFTYNKGVKGKMTIDEWLNAVHGCNTGKALVHPNYCGKVWTQVLQDDGLEEESVKEMQNHPKGFACMFDQMDISFAPPPDLKFTLKGTKGGEAIEEAFEIPPRSKWSAVLECAKKVTDLAEDAFVFRNTDNNHVHFYDDEVVTQKELDVGPLKIVDKLKKGELTIKTLTGKEIKLNIDPANETVLETKQKIQDKEGIPPDQQRLLSYGKQLSDDDKTLADYGVVARQTVNLILRLRGSN